MLNWKLCLCFTLKEKLLPPKSHENYSNSERIILIIICWGKLSEGSHKIRPVSWLQKVGLSEITCYFFNGSANYSGSQSVRGSCVKAVSFWQSETGINHFHDSEWSVLTNWGKVSHSRQTLSSSCSKSLLICSTKILSVTSLSRLSRASFVRNSFDLDRVNVKETEIILSFAWKWGKNVSYLTFSLNLTNSIFVRSLIYSLTSVDTILCH